MQHFLVFKLLFLAALWTLLSAFSCNSIGIGPCDPPPSPVNSDLYGTWESKDIKIDQTPSPLYEMTFIFYSDGTSDRCDRILKKAGLPNPIVTIGNTYSLDIPGTNTLTVGGLVYQVELYVPGYELILVWNGPVNQPAGGWPAPWRAKFQKIL
ncbi:MAG: hypothetical protein KIS77_18485 [Saprospiraceae bacterium]|nr:hypothetical protein [Saprospiraceae bacterium]